MSMGAESARPYNDMPVNHWDSVVMVVIPGTTDGRKVERQVQRGEHELLKNIDTPIEIVRLDLGDAVAREEGTAHLTEAARKDNSVTVIHAGDGSTNYVGNVFVRNGISSPIVPRYSGNANEIAHMANGGKRQHTIEEILAYGNQVPIRPIRTIVHVEAGNEHPEIDDEILSIAWSGFGDGAKLTEFFDSEKHRNRFLYRFEPTRFGLEAVAGLRGLVSRKTIEIEYQGEDGTVQESLFDLTFSNGSRAAKNTVKYPTQINNDDIVISRVSSEERFAKTRYLYAANRGKLPPDFVEGVFDFTLLTDDAPYHSDAQPRRLPGGSEISISKDLRSFNILSMELAA